MTPAAGPLFLLACMALLFGLLLTAGVIEGIARRRADHDCGSGCGYHGYYRAPRRR